MATAKPEPITIEVNESDTVQMEWNGKLYTLYEGVKKPKPAPRPAPKPAPKPAAKKVKYVKPKARSLGPQKEFAAFGPGLTDDSQHSIHTVSMEDKIDAASDEVKERFEALSKYLVETYGCVRRTSFGYDAYRVKGKLIVCLTLGGVHIRVNAAIDPKKYQGTRMKVNDDSANKKYVDVPSYIKILSDKTYQQAYRLIDDAMKANGVKPVKKEG